MTETIRFYSVGDDWGEFSNFADYPITLDGKLWPTSEHYFQAQKFKDAKLRERIRRANTPALAARAGRSRKNPLRRDWDSAKDQVMRDAVRAKFTQHPALSELLLSTGTRCWSSTPRTTPIGATAATAGARTGSAAS